MINKIIEKLKNKKILILGFGREGKTSYNFIRKYLKEQKLVILDEFELKEKIIDFNLEIKIEKITNSNLQGYDLILKSPGISLKNIETDKLNITSQLELLLEVNKKNIIAITGTKGKSTTASLLYDVIKKQNSNTYLLGNIGMPIFEQIELFDENSTLVIETSSHQLQYVKNSPHISLLLNLYPEHLDHYKDLNEYYDSKLNIFKYQNEFDYSIFDIKNVEYISNNKSQKTKINEDIFIEDGFVNIKKGNINLKIYDTKSKRRLLGEHNLKNILFVLAVVDILGLDMEKSVEIINDFEPLEHRIEFVGVYEDIIYYNDSIATIPEATINCIKALKTVNTIIIGGKDRSIDYKELIDYINKSNIENVICLPKTGHDISKNIGKSIYIVEDLNEAVKIAKKVTEKQKICVLSPAASSYGYFKNFEERGKIYKELVRRD